MKRIEMTPMLRNYLIKFAIRIMIFVTVFITYIFHKELLITLMNWPIWKGITPLHILWLIFMTMMILHLFPARKLVSMALKKSMEETDLPDQYSELELYKFVQDQNVKAWKVMLVWLCFNGVFGLLYLLKILTEGDLLMLTVFFFLCDYICILIYCPFQSGIMKNRCCVNCRIFDWGHFMMFTPMLFIKSFFSWSLFFTSCVVLIRWEIVYIGHPERFWYGSNKRIQCANCKDKTCQIKKKTAAFAYKNIV